MRSVIEYIECMVINQHMKLKTTVREEKKRKKHCQLKTPSDIIGWLII